MTAYPRTAVLCSSLLLASLLSQCATEPPYTSGYGSGISLDSGPGRRTRQDTRYLENTVPPPMPNPGMSGTSTLNAPAYDTPESIASTPPTQDQTAPSATSPMTTTPTEPATEQPRETAPSTASAPEQLPFGLPVPGKKGFVYSPFDKTQMVDVRGIPPGKKVRCPYTSNIFLVP